MQFSLLSVLTRHCRHEEDSCPGDARVFSSCVRVVTPDSPVCYIFLFESVESFPNKTVTRCNTSKPRWKYLR